MNAIPGKGKRWKNKKASERLLLINMVTIFGRDNDVIGFAVGEGLAPPEITVKLKSCGEIAKERFLLIENRFPSVMFEDFVNDA